MMDVKTIIKLSEAGFSADEIEEFFAPKDTNGSDPAMDNPKEPAPAAAEPDPAERASAEPAPADSGIEDLKKVINEGFSSIIEAFQVSAVGGSQQKIPTAKTSEDILAEIISPYTKPEGGK